MSRPRLTARGRLVVEVVVLLTWTLAVITTAWALAGPAIFNP